MFWVIKVFLGIKFWRTVLNIFLSMVFFVVLFYMTLQILDNIFINENTYLGLTITDTTAEMGWIKSRDTVRVATIDPKGPAGEAGILVRDVILRVNGEKMYSDIFYETILSYDPGETILVNIRRDTLELELAVTLVDVRK
jgi:S1-C subfamily serine protease